MAGKKKLHDGKPGVRDGMVFGISYAGKSFNVAWQINEQLGLDFQRAPDLKLVLENGQEIEFDMYSSRNEMLKRDYFLVKNKQQGSTASKKFWIYDYLFYIFGQLDDDQAENWHVLLTDSNVFTLVRVLDFNQSDIQI